MVLINNEILTQKMLNIWSCHISVVECDMQTRLTTSRNKNVISYY